MNPKSELLASLLANTRERQRLTLQLLALKDPAERESANRQHRALVGQMSAAFDRLEEMKPAAAERMAIMEALNAATQSRTAEERVIALVMKGRTPS